MIILLGLGNPGKEYEKTRHNVGFRVLDFLRVENALPEFKLEKKFKAEIAEGILGAQKVLLVQPQTYMNLSGDAAQAILNFYKLTPANLIVIHDDTDLPFGTLRIRATGGSGGHNGVKDLLEKLGTENFPRIRLGVSDEFREQTPTDEFVLANFSKEEEKALPEIIGRAAEAVREIVTNGLDVAMNKYN
jgi:PTH1 family peptidyl-tRNA hydrolase